MTLRKLPEPRALARPACYQADPPSDLFAEWAAHPLAAEADDPATLSIYDVIGADMFGDGVTAKRVAGVLRRVGAEPVTVNINSPGGDMFEGIAIYNLLRQHPAAVTVNILGIAASAASVIAMAGDEIAVGTGALIMIHNAWGAVVGNRHDMTEAAAVFAEFDAALADIYTARTGVRRGEIEKMLDAETFMRGAEAVQIGFADRVDGALAPDPAPANDSRGRAIHARRRAEGALAKAGVTRSDRAGLIDDLLSTGIARDADPEPAARDAGISETAVRQLIDILKS